MDYVDTNIILRYVLKDNTNQSSQAKEYFLNLIKQGLHAHTSYLTIFEVVWVLTSYYECSKDKIIQTVRSLLHLDVLVVESADILNKAIIVFECTNISFEDAYHICYAKGLGCTNIKSFDKKLLAVWKKLPNSPTLS